MPKLIYADFFIHYKQGDEFQELLEKANYNVAAAFGLWAKLFRDRMDRVQRISERLQGLAIEGVGDTHHIGLQAKDLAAHEVLMALVAEEEMTAFDEGDGEDGPEDPEDAELVSDDHGESTD